MSIVLVNMNLKGKDLFIFKDLLLDDIMLFLESVIELKEKYKNGEIVILLKGKMLGFIFEKFLIRIRVLFEVGMMQFGGNVFFLSS